MTDENVKRIAKLEYDLSKTRSLNNRLLSLIEENNAEDRSKKNLDFGQITRKQMSEVRRLARINSLAFELLFMMAEKMDRQNAIVMSFKVMQEITGKSRTTLYNAIKTLKDEQWIQVIKIGTASAYILNASVFWSDHAHRKHTVFQATVIASFDEQDKELKENFNKIKLKRVPILIPPERALIADSNEKIEGKISTEIQEEQEELDLN
jgi:Fe2+ or Zn2+ uptake regulation protein